MAEEEGCVPEYLEGHDEYRGLRIGAIFIIFASSALGAFFPLLAKRTIKLPGGVYECVHPSSPSPILLADHSYLSRFAKYFGSGVIISTAFIHLLTPGFEALGSECLAEIWHDYVRLFLKPISLNLFYSFFCHRH